MSGYYLKPAGADLTCAVEWQDGSLAGAECVTDDLGWSVVPVDDAADLRVREQWVGQAGAGVIVEGGRPGRTYIVSGLVGTSAGRHLQRSVVVRVADGEPAA